MDFPLDFRPHFFGMEINIGISWYTWEIHMRSLINLLFFIKSGQ